MINNYVEKEEELYSVKAQAELPKERPTPNYVRNKQATKLFILVDPKSYRRFYSIPNNCTVFIRFLSNQIPH